VGHLLELTKPQDDVRWVLLEAYGGYTMSQPIDLQTRLVYRKDGAPLDPGHGYPLRAWTPGEFGYKNIKWLHRIKFCEEREVDYYMAWNILNGIDPDRWTKATTPASRAG
jgi:DMSO/TMAO reductase YedYZ molybdopterin-dependent catalytic subunit